MIYRVEKVFSRAIVAYVDAESKEEAIRKAENDEVERDFEDYGETQFERAYVGECYDADGEPAMSIEDIEDEDYGDEISEHDYYAIAES